MKIFHFLLILMLSAAGSLQGQQIKRQVIASYGMAHTTASTGVVTLAMTLGQPPNAGTITNSNVVLRQGFQQPTSKGCKITPSFIMQEHSINGCGTYYRFEYTGDIDPTTSISWQFGANGSPMIASGSMPDSIGFTQLGNQTITLTVSNGACQKTIIQNITSTGLPFLADYTKVDAGCFGGKGSINLNISNPAGYTFLWSNGKTTKDLAGLNPGNYAYTVTSTNGCVFSDEVTISGSTKPLLFETHVLDEICTGTKDGSIEFQAAPGADVELNFNWSDGLTCSGPECLTRDSLSAGNYALTVTDQSGCTLDTTFTLQVYCNRNEEDFIPDVFSPNGDGHNDLWNVPMLERFADHTVRIYNRWGSSIWETEGDFMGWDGKNTDGNEMPIGAYFYVIELNDASKKVFKGSVTLIK